MAILERLRSPAEIKTLSMGELRILAGEIRDVIIDTVSDNGGHLASSLGVVELTLALHRVLATPEDRIIWDVGHQAYAHKLITGRLGRFHTLRRLGGISGFPKRQESVYDCFDAGHASTSISAALGIAAARDAVGGREKIVAVIGDGSLTGGLAYEGLNQAGHLKKDLIIVLNDNEMSISPNVGAMASFLSRKLTSDPLVRLRRTVENLIARIPRIGKKFLDIARRAEESLKGFLTPGMLFEALGFRYVGPLNGHRIEELIEALDNVTRLEGPILVHVLTKKGKGYPPAEENPSLFHGVGPFDRVSGAVKEDKGGLGTYTSVFGRTLVELGERDRRIVAVTAAMADGTGLKEFARRFPDRFFDVGIAEGHAVTFAAGLACRGLRPVVAIYSTFLQRAYDQIVHDVCLQNLPVVFALDRGGIVGADGATHQGVFDLSYLRHIPNMTVMAPRDEAELRRAMVTALTHDRPFAYRYPRGNALGLPLDEAPLPLRIGKGDKLRDGPDGVVVAVGAMVFEALRAAERLEDLGIRLAVVDARFVKPLDRDLLCTEALRTGVVVTVEENVLQGGFGGAVLELMEREELSPRLLRIGLGDVFVEQGSQKELRALHGIDGGGIVRRVAAFLDRPAPEAGPLVIHRESAARRLSARSASPGRR
jgi:1-deoxy-D-xylulose-5-phosphate synthase